MKKRQKNISNLNLSIKILYTLFTIFMLFPLLSIAQGVDLKKLESFARKNTWSELNNDLLQSGWSFFESELDYEKGVNRIMWSYKRDITDHAVAFLNAFTLNDKIEKISFQFFSRNTYSTISKQIGAAGYKETINFIDENRIQQQYVSNNYIIDIATISTEDDFGTSTRFNIDIFKKNSFYDTLNGLKKTTHANGNLASEINLKNGMREGIMKEYYENGKIKSIGIYKNDELDGLYTEYDSFGNVSKEVQFKDGVPDGSVNIYEAGKISVQTNYLNGLQHGKRVEYNYYEDDQIIEQYQATYKEDRKEGQYLRILFRNNGMSDTIEYKTYHDGHLNGPCKVLLTEDSMLIGSYKNDLLHGPCSLFTVLTAYETEDLTESFNWIPSEIGTYNFGLKSGEWKEYTFGQLTSSGNYQNNLKTGKWIKYIFWGENETLGQVLGYDNYANGKKNGESVTFFDLTFERTSEDQITPKYTKGYTSTIYLNDLKEGESFYKNAQGSLINTGRYKADKKEGLWSYYDELGRIQLEENYKHGVIIESNNFSNLEFKSINTEFKDGKPLVIHYMKNDDNPIEHKIYHTLYNTMYIEETMKGDGDRTEIQTFKMETDTYSYENFKSYAVKDGSYKCYVGKELIITGIYETNLKVGIWNHYLPSQKAYYTSTYESGVKSEIELFYQKENNLPYSGKLIIPTEENGTEAVKIKKGLKEGKAILFDRNNNELGTLKYSSGRAK